MESEGSLTCSRDHGTKLYLIHTITARYIKIFSSDLRLDLKTDLFHWTFPKKCVALLSPKSYQILSQFHLLWFEGLNDIMLPTSYETSLHMFYYFFFLVPKFVFKHTTSIEKFVNKYLVLDKKAYVKFCQLWLMSKVYRRICWIGVLREVNMRRNIFWNLTPYGLVRIFLLDACSLLDSCLAHSWALKMEALYSYETKVDFYQTICYHFLQ
jgi:hypothetical protein